MPKGFGIGLRVATIPVAGIEPLSAEGDGGGGGGGVPPSSGGGGSVGGGGSAGGIGGGIGLIGLLLLALGLGVPALVASDDEQAQVQQSGGAEVERVKLGAFEAE